MTPKATKADQRNDPVTLIRVVQKQNKTIATILDGALGNQGFQTVYDLVTLIWVVHCTLCKTKIIATVILVVSLGLTMKSQMVISV